MKYSRSMCLCDFKNEVFVCDITQVRITEQGT